jgi:hypothetical protein
MSPPFAPVCASLAPVSFTIVAHILEPPPNRGAPVSRALRERQTGAHASRGGYPPLVGLDTAPHSRQLGNSAEHIGSGAARLQGVHPSIEKKVTSRAAQARHCSPMRTACTPPWRIPLAYQWSAHNRQLCAGPEGHSSTAPLGQQAIRATPGGMSSSRSTAAPSNAKESAIPKTKN